jgi:hypothetical protein
MNVCQYSCLIYRMRSIVLSSMAWLIPPYFSTLSRNDFRKKKFTEHRTSVLILSIILSETFFIVRRIQ